MNNHLIWLVPLALAGCKRQPEVEVKNASVAEVTAKMQETGVANTTLRPGLWATTVKVDNIAAPGVPADVEQQMRAGIGRTQTMTECLTAENAKKPFQRFVEGLKDNCRYDRFSMGGGKIDSKLVCTNAGMSRSMTMQGSYTPDQYKMQMVSEMMGQGPVKHINMTMTLDARRTGDCPKNQG